MRLPLLTAAWMAASAPAAAIVGASGADATLEAQTLMVLKRSGAAAGFCSGVVLSQRLVLTAAHCVAGAADTRLHFRDASGAPILAAIDRIAIHPAYRAGAAERRERSIDLAIVRAAQPLPARFATARLSTREALAIGERVRLGGYGVARENAAETSGVFRVATLATRAPLSKILLWSEDGAGAGAGACTGDSGGPMADGSGAIVAIAAWSAGQGRRGCGGVTQGILIAPQRDWIERVVDALSR
ncbi:MAG: S1 family peptidase [Methylobacteriaceae bacterium]|nr:S1 family peptidase [Methylobacteriaceae bacterium]